MTVKIKELIVIGKQYISLKFAPLYQPNYVFNNLVVCLFKMIISYKLVFRLKREQGHSSLTIKSHLIFKLLTSDLVSLKDQQLSLILITCINIIHWQFLDSVTEYSSH